MGMVYARSDLRQCAAGMNHGGPASRGSQAKSDISQQAQTACRRRHKTRGPGAKSGSGHSRERFQHPTCRTRAAAAPEGAWAGSRQGAHAFRPSRSPEGIASRSPEGILPRTQRASRNLGRESCDESYNHLFRFSQTAPRGCGPARDRTLQVFPVVSRSPEVHRRSAPPNATSHVHVHADYWTVCQVYLPDVDLMSTVILSWPPIPAFIFIFVTVA